jgi:hypothetical protein
VIRRCTEAGCPNVVRWVDRCHAHRATATPSAEATLRARHAEGTTWLAVPDVAALRLDAAVTADAHPEMTASAALRGLADGLARYDTPPPKEHP